jgi:ribonuclease R
VTVQVSRVDLDARKIDLRLVTEPGIHTVLKNEARRADGEQVRDKKTKAKSTRGAGEAGKAGQAKRGRSTVAKGSAPSRPKAGKRKR